MAIDASKIVTEDGFSVSLLGEQTWPPKFVDVKYWSEGSFNIDIKRKDDENAKDVGDKGQQRNNNLRFTR